MARTGVVICAAVLGALVSLGTAGATHRPDTVLEQHWEMLGETRTVTGATSVPVWRGTLPGGTAKFDPQPTATLEVVAKVTGASEISGAPVWAAHLRSNTGTILATAQFHATDTSLTLATGELTWPSLDRRVGDVLLEPIAAVPGTLEVKKAYVKIRQQGTVNATSGRFHLAQASTVSSLSWSDVADPILYRHVAGDFDPAPGLRLRVSGSAALGGADVRLVDQTGAVVAGSQLSFSGIETKSTAVASGTNQETGPLDLLTGSTYRLQAKGTGGFKLFGADLIFEQATGDAHGLTSTVAWFTGVPVATDIVADQEDLAFPFRLPQIVAAYRTDAWTGTLRRTAGTGSVGVALTDNTGQELARISTTSASYVHASSSASPSTPWMRSSSAARLSTDDPLNPTAGRVAQTALRVHAKLKDTVAPVIAAYNATNPAFSPDADGAKDTTTLSATLIDVSPPVAWTVTVTDGSGTTIRTASGSTSAAMSWTWDGKNSAGTAVADGSYTATLTATDSVGNASNSALTLKVDTIAPTATALIAAPDPFSPNADGYLDTTTFSTTLSESLPWSLAIKNSSGTTVKTFTGTGSAVAQSWDGLLVGNGLYTGVWTASDAAGNSASTSDTVTRDATGPSITSYAASPTPFSPNADGVKDTLTVTANLSDTWARIDWTIDIKDAALTVVRSFYGQGTGVSATWDGTDSAGADAPEGLYTVTLTATDAGRNASTRLSVVEVDVTAPAVVAASMAPNPFVPTGLAPRDEVEITAELDDSVDSWWWLQIRDTDGVVIKEFGEFGGDIHALWDGRNANGAVVPDGPYEVVIGTNEPAGNQEQMTDWVTVGDGPVVVAVSPTVIQRGKEVRIQGTGFGTRVTPSTVTIGGDEADVVSWSDTEIVVYPPRELERGLQQLDVWVAELTSQPVAVQAANYLLSPGPTAIQPGRILIRIASGANLSTILAARGDSGATQLHPGDAHLVLQRWYEVPVPAGSENSRILAYSADPNVEWAEPVLLGHATGIPNDTRWSEQWGLHDDSAGINAPHAWDFFTGGTSITVGVIDSGIAASHPDLNAKVLPGADLTGSGTTADCATHGTHVAGIAAAETNNSQGVAGVSWGANVRPYKVMYGSNCNATDSKLVAQAIRKAATGSHVLNMSLSSNDPVGCPESQQDAINVAFREQRRVIVASAGNDNHWRQHWPGNCTRVLSVGASNASGTRAGFSNYGRWVDLFAPGEGILSTVKLSDGTFDYRYVSGTSMAAPMVSGSAALLRSRLSSPGVIMATLTGTTKGSLGRLSVGGAVDSLFADLSNGQWARMKNGPVWFLDNGKRRYATSQVRRTWGVIGSQIATVQRGQLLEFDRGAPMGLAPGTIVSIATGQIDRTKLYAITNDGSWTTGQKRPIVATAMTCLGYNDRYVELIGQGLADRHATNGTTVASCDRHPNGAVLQHSNGGFFVLQNGQKRPVPSDAIRNSWAMGRKVAAQGTVVNLELSQLSSMADMGFRPGSLVKDGKRVHLITANGSDFARSDRRYFNNSENRNLGALPCYGYSTDNSRGIAYDAGGKLALHDVGATLTC